MTVKELAALLGVTDTDVIKTLFMMGLPRTVNQTVERPWVKDAATLLGFIVQMPDPNELEA